MLQILLDNSTHKVDLSAKCDEGRTALEIAAIEGRWDFINLMTKSRNFKWNQVNADQVVFLAAGNERFVNVTDGL